MDTVTIEVPRDEADRFVESMEDEVNRIDNVLNSFRSNSLTDTEAYRDLQTRKEDIEVGIEEVEEQIESQEPEGLAELFG